MKQKPKSLFFFPNKRKLKHVVTDLINEVSRSEKKHLHPSSQQPTSIAAAATPSPFETTTATMTTTTAVTSTTVTATASVIF